MSEYKCKTCGAELRVSIERTTGESCPVEDDGHVVSDGYGDVSSVEATVYCVGDEGHQDEDTGFVCEMDDDGEWKLVPVADQPVGEEAAAS